MLIGRSIEEDGERHYGHYKGVRGHHFGPVSASAAFSRRPQRCPQAWTPTSYEVATPPLGSSWVTCCLDNAMIFQSELLTVKDAADRVKPCVSLSGLPGTARAMLMVRNSRRFTDAVMPHNGSPLSHKCLLLIIRFYCSRPAMNLRRSVTVPVKVYLKLDDISVSKEEIRVGRLSRVAACPVSARDLPDGLSHHLAASLPRCPVTPRPR